MFAILCLLLFVTLSLAGPPREGDGAARCHWAALGQSITAADRATLRGKRLLDAYSEANLLADEARYYTVPRAWQRLLSRHAPSGGAAGGGADDADSEKHGAATVVADGTPHGALLGDCVAWHQTGGCTPLGPVERRGSCDEEVPSGSSGYCECAKPSSPPVPTDSDDAGESLIGARGDRTPEWRGPGYGCKHTPFTCKALCGLRREARLSDDAVEAKYRSYGPSLRGAPPSDGGGDSGGGAPLQGVDGPAQRRPLPNAALLEGIWEDAYAAADGDVGADVDDDVDVGTGPKEGAAFLQWAELAKGGGGNGNSKGKGPRRKNPLAPARGDDEGGGAIGRRGSSDQYWRQRLADDGSPVNGTARRQWSPHGHVSRIQRWAKSDAGDDLGAGKGRAGRGGGERKDDPAARAARAAGLDPRSADHYGFVVKKRARGVEGEGEGPKVAEGLHVVEKDGAAGGDDNGEEGRELALHLSPPLHRALDSFLQWDDDEDVVAAEEAAEEEAQRRRGVPAAERLPLPTLTYAQEASLKRLQRRRMHQAIAKRKGSSSSNSAGHGEHASSSSGAAEPFVDRPAEWYQSRRLAAEEASARHAQRHYNSILMARRRQQLKATATERYRMLKQHVHLYGHGDTDTLLSMNSMHLFARYLSVGEAFADGQGGSSTSSGRDHGNGKGSHHDSARQRMMTAADEALELQRLHEYDYALPKEAAGDAKANGPEGDVDAEHHSRAVPVIEEMRVMLRRFVKARREGLGGRESGGRHPNAAAAAVGAVGGNGTLSSPAADPHAHTHHASVDESAFLSSQLVQRLLVDALPTSEDVWRNASLQSSPMAALAFVEQMTAQVATCRIQRVTTLLMSRKRFVTLFAATGPASGKGSGNPHGGARHERARLEAKALAVLREDLADRLPTASELPVVLALFHRFMRGWAHLLDEALIGACGVGAGGGEEGALYRPFVPLSPTLDGSEAFALDYAMHDLVYSKS